ncbi:MAG TPA: PH domain-containing protein, partial [Acidimicrobiales bacterium]|nr:PH domain-containing protein [Acidimicrobiales bacterium]
MPPGSEDADDGTGFVRLHPLTPLAFAGRAAGILAAFLLLGRFERTNSGSSGHSGVLVTLIILGSFALLMVLRGVIDYAVTRYRLEPTEFRVDSGLLQRRSKRVRLNRLQSVDVTQPLTARVLGLAELRLTTAGSERASLRLRYVSLPVAQELRAELLGRSAGAGPGVPEAPERPLVTVPPGTLLAAVLLQLVSWRLLLLLLGPALAYLGSREDTAHPAATGVGVGLFVYGLLIVAHFVWRRVTELWDFTVAEAPDGVRIRRGLLATSAQTVPFDRIQALRVHQPFLFRPFGWAIVRMNVAGYVGRREAASTVLLPVAPRAYAEWLAGRVLGVDLGAVELTPPPSRARLRAPLWWRAERAGSNDRIFVTRHGLFSRSVEAVAHQRTQSVRLVAGPWQRA